MGDLNEEIFLQRICSHPGDNLAVGIYSDWLEEQGSPEAERVRNFYHGMPLSTNLKKLCGQLSPEQQLPCAILIAKDVLPIFEKAVLDETAPRQAITAAEKGTVTQEILDAAYHAVDNHDDVSYAAYTAAYWAAWAAIYVARAAYAADAAYAAYAAYAANAAYTTAWSALQAKPERREAYLMIISSFILFDCNAVVLE